MNHDAFLVPPGAKISLQKNYDPAYTANYHDRNDATLKLRSDIERLAKYQDVLYAQNSYPSSVSFRIK